MREKLRGSIGGRSPTSQWARGFLVGVGAGAAALAFSYVLRLFAGGVFLPEVAAEALFSVTPGQVESGAVQNLGPLAKYSAFAGSILVNLLVYGAMGALLYRYSDKLQARTATGRVSAFSLTACAVYSLLTFAFTGLSQILGDPLLIPVVVVYALPPNIAFGFVLASLERRTIASEQTICRAPEVAKGGFSRKRRLVIRSGIAAAVAGALLAYGLELFMAPPKAPEAPPDPTALLAREVTPNDGFYRVDINIIVPQVDPKQWTLTVGGLVNRPISLSYGDLIAMGAVEQFNTLECVSNNVGGNLISTAKWKGVRLKDVLSKAGVGDGAQYVVFKCADNYDVGIPIGTGLLDGTLLAYEMNGVALPVEHGSPLRAVVPGLYGMMNPKWITRVELVNDTYEGYWQRSGWANDAHYQTGSMVVIPGASEIDSRFGIGGTSTVLDGKVPIAGIAFAGDRGIANVEVSTDGGRTWSQASIKDPLSGYTWVLWSAEWNPPSQGDYQISVRATDKAGALQTAVVTAPFPNGATGYHIVDITVAKDS